MSFRDFTFTDVESRLGLVLTEEHLFADISAIAPRQELLDTLAEGAEMSQGVNGEKAKSEFLIAPVLREFRRLRERKNAVFSGVEFNVDAEKGLNGYCDFLITRGPRQSIVTAPVIAVAEGKNDSVTHGLGQCIAGMRAAWLFNEQKHEPINQVYGATTTGLHWKFLRLRDTQVVLDADGYFIPPNVGQILAILLHMAETA